MTKYAFRAIRDHKNIEKAVFESNVIGKDGNLIPVEITGRVLLDKRGLPIGVEGIIKDISNRTRNQSIQLLPLAKLRSSLNTSNLIWWEYDRSTKKFTCDERVVQLLSLQVHLADHHDLVDSIHPEDQEKVRVAIKSIEEGDLTGYTLEYRVYGEDGKIRWLRDQCGTTFRSDNKTDDQIAGVIQDITENKLAEMMLKDRLSLQLFSENHSPTELLTKTLDLVCSYTSSEIGFFHLVDEDQNNVKLQAWSTATNEEHWSISEDDLLRYYPIKTAGVWADAIRDRKTIIHNDYQSLENKQGFPSGHADLVREAVVPIIKNDIVAAVIGLGNKKKPYTNNDITLIEYYGDVAWEIFEKINSQEKMERKMLEQKILYELSSFASRSTDEDELIAFATRILFENLFPDHLGFLFRSPDSNTIKVHPTYSGIEAEEKGMEFKLAEGIVGHVISSGETAILDDTTKSADYLSGSNQQMLSELCVPILLDNKTIGAINAESQHRQFFTSDDKRFLETIANEISSGIKRIRLLQREIQRRVEAEIAETLSHQLTSTLNLDEIFEIIFDHMQPYLEYDSSSIFIKENDALKIVAARGISDADRLIGLKISHLEEDQLFAEIITSRSFIILHDAVADERFKDYDGSGSIRGWLGVPLIDEGEVIGYITFDSHQPGKFSQASAQLAQTIVNLASGAISRAKLFEQTNIRHNRLQALHEIDQVITSTLDINTSYETFLKIVCSNLEIDAAAILVYDEDSQTLRFNSSYGFRTNALRSTNIELGVGYAGISALEQQPLYIPELRGKQSLFSKSKHFENG